MKKKEELGLGAFFLKGERGRLEKESFFFFFFGENFGLHQSYFPPRVRPPPTYKEKGKGGGGPPSCVIVSKRNLHFLSLFSPRGNVWWVAGSVLLGDGNADLNLGSNGSTCRIRGSWGRKGAPKRASSFLQKYDATTDTKMMLRTHEAASVPRKKRKKKLDVPVCASKNNPDSFLFCGLPADVDADRNLSPFPHPFSQDFFYKRGGDN